MQRGDASRRSSTGSARATLLQRGDASRGSSTESARATLLQRGDASRAHVDKKISSILVVMHRVGAVNLVIFAFHAS